MTTIPKQVTLTNSSVDILNAIRNSATINYQKYVPAATNDADSIRVIGSIIMDSPNLQNEFLNALVNRIARVIVTSKTYSNPIAMFKKGYIELGETIEDIFVNIAKPFQYSPELAETTFMAREIPDVRATFYVMNFQKYYKSTIQNTDLKTAFLSWGGVANLIAKIVDSMYTGSSYDEFITMKYMLARRILDGRLYAVQIPTVSATNADEIVTTVKTASNNFTFLNTQYNPTGVYTNSIKDEQFVIVSSEFDAIMDVNVLATAFNMDKAEFAGHRVLIDSFGNLDTARLNILFAGDPNYEEIGKSDLTLLDNIPAVLVDRDFFMVFDNLNKFTENENGQGLYWQYYYHVWKTFACSPYANAAVFVTGQPSVTSITVSPSLVTVDIGQSVHFSATVQTTNFAPKSVTWSSSDENVIIDERGVATVLEGATGAITITATSTYNNTVTGTATLNVATGD